MIDRRAWLFMVGGGLLAACTASPEDPATVQPDPAETSKPIDHKADSSPPAQLKLTGEGQKIGRTYQRQVPQEATEAALRAALPQGAAAAQAQIVTDYADDDVVVLRGWILARTEARLLALGALQGGTATF